MTEQSRPCPTCGNPGAEGGKFCMACGRSIPGVQQGPEEGARLHLVRRKSWVGSARHFKVIIDGRQAGVLPNDQTLDLFVATGPHRVAFALGRKVSPSLSFISVAGQAVAFECVMAAGLFSTSLVLEPRIPPAASAGHHS